MNNKSFDKRLKAGCLMLLYLGGGALLFGTLMITVFAVGDWNFNYFTSIFPKLARVSFLIGAIGFMGGVFYNE